MRKKKQCTSRFTMDMLRHCEFQWVEFRPCDTAAVTTYNTHPSSTQAGSFVLCGALCAASASFEDTL